MSSCDSLLEDGPPIVASAECKAHLDNKKRLIDGRETDKVRGKIFQRWQQRNKPYLVPDVGRLRAKHSTSHCAGAGNALKLRTHIWK